MSLRVFGDCGDESQSLGSLFGELTPEDFDLEEVEGTLHEGGSHGSHSLVVGNTKKIPPKKRESAKNLWFFTMNLDKFLSGSHGSHGSYGLEGGGYSRQLLSDLSPAIDMLEAVLAKCKKYAVQLERGETGNFHFQGAISLAREHKMRFAQLKAALASCHLEILGGEKGFTYCLKTDNSTVLGEDGKPLYRKSLKVAVPAPPIKKINRSDLREDQIEWYDLMLNSEPDDRSVYWLYDSRGGWGKSFLAKALFDGGEDGQVMVINGKWHDIANQFTTHFDQKKRYPSVVVMDVPRCLTEGEAKYVSYLAIEKVKDGFFYSGKFEGAVHRFDSPHVLVLSNVPPTYSKLSLDRWKCWELFAGQGKVPRPPPEYTAQAPGLILHN